jgi:3-deoxy-manno-octulosonate cytidylyltransferase (CMP-KDO synthetase)
LAQHEVAVLIPARRASTRLPDKVLLAETGTPLVVHTCRRAAQAFGADRVLVCTDDDAVRTAVSAEGFSVRMTDPAHRSGTDRIAEAAAELDAGIVVNVQADEPEIDPEHVRLVAELLERQPWAELSTLAAPAGAAEQRDPNCVKVVLGDRGRALWFGREPLPWDRDAGAPAARCLRHLGIYAYRRSLLLRYRELPPTPLEELEKLEQLRALAAGVGIACAVVEHPAPGIDVRADYDAFVARWRADQQVEGR